MIDALRYEWTRIITIRSTYWLTGLALAFAVGVSVAIAWGFASTIGDPGGPTDQDITELGPWLGTQFARGGAPHVLGFLLAMIGILAWGHEYRHGMVRATLTTLSSRTAVWFAKYVVVLVWVSVAVTACFYASIFVGWLFLRDYAVDLVNASTYEAWARAVLYAVLLACLAMAFTGLVRNQTAALVLLFLWPLAIENVITLVFFLVPGLRDHSELTRFLPFTAGGRIQNDSFFSAGTTIFGDPMTWVGGLVVFGGLSAVLMATSLALFRVRDA